MNLSNPAQVNFRVLSENPYPGRGLVLGTTREGLCVQIYWIMGRSSNSRNRVFERHGEEVATKAADPLKLEDPSLIIYFPVRVVGDLHIVSNGDQTDTIAEHLKTVHGGSSQAAFVDSLSNRRYEPDAPHFTPRISGLTDLKTSVRAFSVVKSTLQIDGLCQRDYFFYADSSPGFGHCVHTYLGNGNPLPSFSGEPLLMPINGEDAAEIAENWWSVLNEENSISLLAKTIDPKNGRSNLHIINKYAEL